MKIYTHLLSSDPFFTHLQGEAGYSESQTITSIDPRLHNTVYSMLQQFEEIHLFKIMLGLFFIFLFVQALRFYLIMFRDLHPKTSRTPPISKTKVPKRTKYKKYQHVTKSDDGLGYWGKGYGGDMSYVPLTALYPEGTDMDEVEKLKKREPQQGKHKD
ncbi:hypothetical protein OM416_19730 [Paenibacillus sp. LS1]|uniref:hypothetical protein n=1 Tax=Paenibacillus sp. LS1 TaxID=2992120 RepID=UPI00222F8402|nr:hypothetical protein [Paenibacillus sp. LS1]MCW3793826.1 hypothetical protein [Paenibacillus sp. LS1]